MSIPRSCVKLFSYDEQAAFGRLLPQQPPFPGDESVRFLKTVKNYVRRNPHIWLVLYFPVYLLAFFTVEHFIDGSSDYWVSYMPVDDRIPFCEVFVIPYCLWYPYLAATALKLLIAGDAKNFKRYMYFIAAGFSLGLVIFCLFPNGQDLRPAEFERDNVFTWLVGCLYAADTNTNVLPSLHVVGTLAGVFAAFHAPSMRRWRWPWLILSVLICLSTVFIKQHSVLDILAGIAMSIPLYLLIYTLPERKEAIS